MSKSKDVIVTGVNTANIDLIPRYYLAEVAIPPGTPEDKRDELPAWKNLQRRPWSVPITESVSGPNWGFVSIGFDPDNKFSYRDYPGVRRASIKTVRRDWIDEASKLPGVKLTEVERPQFHTICGTYLNAEEYDEMMRILEEKGPDARQEYFEMKASKYDTEVWPVVRAKILAAIKRYDPSALREIVDEKSTRVILIKTKSDALLRALSDIEYACVEEAPLLTDADVPGYKWRMRMNEPPTPVLPAPQKFPALAPPRPK